MKAQFMWLTAAALVLACGCADPPAIPTEKSNSLHSVSAETKPRSAGSAQPQSTPPANTQLAARQLAAESYVATLERIAGYFTAHAKKCRELAMALEAATEDRERLAALSTGGVDEVANADPILSPRLTAATNTIADGSMACAQNKAFTAMQAKLFPKAPRK